MSDGYFDKGRWIETPEKDGYFVTDREHQNNLDTIKQLRTDRAGLLNINNELCEIIFEYHNANLVKRLKYLFTGRVE